MTMSKLRNLLTISILVLTLSGCFGAILGAAAGGAGAYYTKKELDKSNSRKSRAIEKKTRIEERNKFSQQVKESVSKDEQISLDLTSKMLGGGLTKILSVHSIVKDGVVTLYGNAPSQEVVNRAIDMARREAGVKKVINNLVVVNVRIVAPQALQRSESSIAPSTTTHASNPVNRVSPIVPIDPRKLRAMDLEKKISELEEKGKRNQKELEDNPLIRQLKEDGTLEKHSAFEKARQEMRAELNGDNNNGEVTGLTLPKRVKR